MTSKTARYAATVAMVLLLMVAHWSALAQPTESPQLQDMAVAHPVPVTPEPPFMKTGTQPPKCQLARLVPLVRRYVMPDVVGCIASVVVDIFTKLEINVAKPKLAASDSPKGIVLEQDPRADTGLTPDKQVTLTISTGPGPQASQGDDVQPARTVTVPDVHELEVAGAVQAIEDRHLRPILGDKEFSDTPRGRVSRTDPPAYATVAQGREVTYWVSLGKRPIPMAIVPDVHELDVAGAVKAIEGRHLRPILGDKESSDVPRGRVSHTDPPAYASVPQGSPVKYWLSLGPVSGPWPPPAATVPSVIGETAADATATLRAAGFAAGEPIPELSLAGTGRISRQDPPAGSRVPRGTIVLLWWPYAWLSVTGLVVIPLLILGSAAGLVFNHIDAKRRLAYTRAVLHIRPSLALDGETRLVGASPPIGPTVVLRASLQPGEVRFVEPVSIERQEIQHD